MSYTIIIDASSITGSLNWINQTHKVEVSNSGNFTVRSSNAVEGRGTTARDFVETMKKRLKDEKQHESDIQDFADQVLNRIEEAVKEKKIRGRSEHTFVFLIKNIENETIRYLQLPIQVRGLEEHENEKLRQQIRFR